MSDLPAARVPDPRSPASWRPRHAERLDFIRRHTCTLDQIERKFFTGRTVATRAKKASRWLSGQRRRGRIAVVGVVQRRDTGRPEIAHGRRCKPTEVEHEVMVCEFEVLTGFRLERSRKRGKTEPDGTGEAYGIPFSLEVDNTGKMTRKQMQAKWRKYQGVQGFVFVVATDESRMQRLREWACEFQDVGLLFSTFDRIRHGRPWVDWSGKTLKLAETEETSGSEAMTEP